MSEINRFNIETCRVEFSARSPNVVVDMVAVSKLIIRSFTFFFIFFHKMKSLRVGFSLLYLLYLLASVQSQSSPDASTMQALKASLGNSASLDWSDQDPCQWAYVECSKSDRRVTKVQIGEQNLKGTLPPDLKNLTSLIILEVMRNQLTGPIPSLAGLSSLQEVLFTDNGFTSMPPDFFKGMTSLVSIYLDYNNFSAWQIPESLKDATSLETFSATQGNITGPIPEFLGDAFPGLKNLHLAFNPLEGSIPSSFAKSSIQSLWLNNRRVDSKLNGSIAVIQNMTSLTQVWLPGNKFTGPIPDLSGLVNLKDLSLRDNQLTGIVPKSVVSLPSLTVVNLTNNWLQGPTPKFDTKKVAVDMNPGSNRFCLDQPGAETAVCDDRVNVLLSIVEPLGYPAVFAQDWQGNNPCSQKWTGINCAGENITIINFQGRGLSGTISPDFSKLKSLRQLLLSNNLLDGTIPNELTTLTNLEKVDVSNNHLYGRVPNFSKNVVVITDGNPDIGKDSSRFSPPGAPPSGDKGSNGRGGSKNSNTGKVVGSVVGAVCGAFIVGIGVCLHARMQWRACRVQSPNTVVIHPRNEGDGNAVNIHVAEAGNKVIPIQVLRDVTSNFSEENILGRGGFGTVYKGELLDGKKIAVKRMESGVVSENHLSEFKTEIAVLTNVRHRHLVALFGHCLEGNERLLVYEYMPQGTLSRYLFNWKQEGLKPLEWKTRLIIALDVARGVEYLHSLAHQSFIHRDLKPCNILLGYDLRAKVADFGLVRLAPENGQRSIETKVAGTFGYLAPEYAVTGRVTTKVDVFSFGVILMELITGRKAVDSSQPEEDIHLVSWFRRMHTNKIKSFPNAIDQTLELDDEILVSVSTVAELALHCCAKESYLRPDMAHVVNVLSSLAEQWKPAEPEPELDDTNDLDLEFASLPSKLHSSTTNSISPLPMVKLMAHTL